MAAAAARRAGAGGSRTESFSLSGFLWSDGLGISSPFSPPVVQSPVGKRGIGFVDAIFRCRLRRNLLCA